MNRIFRFLGSIWNDIKDFLAVAFISLIILVPVGLLSFSVGSILYWLTNKPIDEDTGFIGFVFCAVILLVIIGFQKTYSYFADKWQNSKL